MSNAMIYAGIAIGVAAMAGIMVYAHDNQQNYVPEDATLAPASLEGAFSSESGLGANLNSEQWHEDPYAELAQKIREQNGR